MACPQGKRSPCRRSGQGAVGRPEREGLRGLRVPDTLWRAAAGGPGHATGQAWSSTRFGRHRPLKTTASRAPPCTQRCRGSRRRSGASRTGRMPTAGRVGPVPEHATQAPAARAEPSWAGEVRVLPSEDGPGSGVWQAEDRLGGEGAALRVQEALPRTRKGQIPGPREEAGEQGQGGAKQAGRAPGGPRPGGGGCCRGGAHIQPGG